MILDTVNHHEVAEGNGGSVGYHIQKGAKVRSLIKVACKLAIDSIEELGSCQVRHCYVKLAIRSIERGACSKEQKYKSNPPYYFWNIRGNLDVLDEGLVLPTFS